MAEDYVIWSNEHRAWWGPDKCGYRSALEGAGLYSRQEALDIAGSVRGGWTKGKNPDEIAIPLADAKEQALHPHRLEAWGNSIPPTEGTHP